MMIKLAILLMSATITASTIPAAASQSASPAALAATRTHWAAVRSQLSKATDREAACRAYAASFYESLTMRQAAVGCIGYPDIAALLLAFAGPSPSQQRIQVRHPVPHQPRRHASIAAWTNVRKFVRFCSFRSSRNTSARPCKSERVQTSVERDPDVR